MDIDKQYKKIKRMKIDIKGNYILQTILGVIIGLFLKWLIFDNILVIILCITISLYSSYTYAKRQNEKIDKLRWELDMYLKEK